MDTGEGEARISSAVEEGVLSAPASAHLPEATERALRRQELIDAGIINLDRVNP